MSNFAVSYPSVMHGIFSSQNFCKASRLLEVFKLIIGTLYEEKFFLFISKITGHILVGNPLHGFVATNYPCF